MARLTTAQSAMLFDQIADPTNVGNNVVASMIVSSSASVTMHERAWRDALARHPILHSRIVGQDNGFEFETTTGPMSVDVAAVPDVRDRIVREDLGRAVLRPFDLFVGPLVRVSVRCDGTRSVVSLVVHHVLIDVASAPMILNDYFAHLRGLEHGERGHVLPPATTMDQFVDAELDYLSSNEAELDRDYWRGELAGYRGDPLAGLPASVDGGHDPLEPYVRLEAEPTATSAVRRRAEGLSVAPAAVLLAVYLRALATVGGRPTSDLAVGLPVLRRDARHLTTLGSFTQLAVARAQVGVSLDADILSAGAALAGAKKHGQLPFSEIAKFSDDPSALTRTTFLYEPSYLGFGTAFILGDHWELDMSGYGGNPYPVPSQTGQFDMRFQAGLVNGRYVCAVHHGPSRHRAAVAVAEHIRNELRQIAGSESIDLVEPGAFGSGWVHPAHLVATTRSIDVITRIRDSVIGRPTCPAVSCGSSTITYSELWASANHLAERFAGCRGKLIAVVMPKVHETIAAVIGIMLSGNAFVVVDPAYPQSRRAVMLTDVDGVVVHSTTRSAVPSSFGGLVVEFGSEISSGGATDLTTPGGFPAYAVYTSGTTGRPKRVLVSRDALATSTAARDDVYREQPSRFLHLSSLSFDSALAGLFWTLVCGGELILLDLSEPRSTTELADEIAQRDVTHLLAIPSLYDALLDEAGRIGCLRQVVVAGEECSEALAARHHHALPGVVLTNEYGPSESAIWSTADHIHRRGPVTIGRPVPGIAIRVVDENGLLVGPGLSGELHISGTLAFGYDGDSRATAAKFLPDPHARDGGRVYATGDQVRAAPDGRLIFGGRLDEQLKISGFRVEPREVEALVRRVIGCECVAGAITTSIGKRELVVAIPESTFSDLDVAAALSTIRDEVPPHLVPRAMYSIGRIPRNVNGKVDRRAVAEFLGSIPSTDSAVCPVADEVDVGVDAVVIDAVRTALSVEVRPGRSFVDHGGDSIAAMRVVGYLHRRGLSLSPRQLLASKPLAELAPNVQSRGTRATFDVKPSDTRPTTRAQRAMLLQTSINASSGVYVEQLVLDLAGSVDITRLADAWRRVFATFPVLGAAVHDAPYPAFDTGGGDTVSIEIRSGAVDWTSILAQDRVRGFDLVSDRLSRVLLASGPDGVRVLWTHHHAVADGWSLPIVIGALASAYRGEGVPDAQLSSPSTVQGFAAEYLSAAPELFDQVPLPQTSDKRIRSSSHCINPGDIDGIAERLGVTVATVVNLVWSLTLASTFGAQTVEHGMVSSGRDISVPEMDSAVGMFVRIDPVSARWSANRTLSTMARSVAQQVSTAIDGPVSTGWTPETLVVVENYPLDPSVLSFGSDVRVTSIDLAEQTEFPVVLQYRRWPESLYHLHIDTSRVPNDVAEAIVRRVREVSALLVTAPAEVGVDWFLESTDAASVRGAEPDSIESVVSKVASHAQSHPARRAIVHSESTLTYRELDDLRVALAQSATAAGVAPGHVVGVRATSQSILAPVLLALATIGATWMVVDDDLPEQRVAKMLSSSGAHWTVVPGGAFVATDAVRPPDGRASVTDLAYLIFTSGTTGDPKAIAVSQSALSQHLSSICARFDYLPTDSILVFGSLAFDASVEQLFGALYAGATAISRPREMVDPSEVAAFMREQRVTVFNPPTGYWARFIDEPLPESLRTVIVGGEALPSWATTVPDGVALWNAYGPTEGVITALAHLVTQNYKDSVPIGSVQNGRDAVLLGRDHLPVADGVIGEIWLSGILATGYIGDPRATAEAFRPHPNGADRIYGTGDLAVREADGGLSYVGRRDRQVKIRGYRVDPMEVEAAAVNVDGVRSAHALLVAPSNNAAARLECAVATEDASVTASSVRAALERVLPAHIVPSRIHVLESIPLTRSGKVDADAIRAAIPTHFDIVDKAEGVADVNEIVYRAMQVVLGDVDRVTGFISAGGDSLRALELAAVARRSGVVVDLTVALRNGTTDDLVATADVDPSVSVAGVQPARSGLLPPAVHWFHERVSEHAVSPWNMAVRIDLKSTPESAAVDAAVREVLRVHPMLRVRLDDGDFVLSDASPVVFFFDTAANETENACKRIFNSLSGRVAIDNGTPVGFGVVRTLDEGRATMIIVAHHLVMDVVSLQIVAGDVLDAIEHSAESDFRLPSERTSVHEWVKWLRSEAGRPGMDEQLRAAYRGVASGEKHLDAGTEGDAVAVVRVVPASMIISASEMLNASVEEILQYAAATAIADTVGIDPVVIEVETHGRDLDSDAVDLTRTVGWFTSLTPVPIHIQDAGTSIAEIRARRAFLGRSGQLAGSARYLLDAAASPHPAPHIGVNYVGRLDDKAGSIRAYGTGHLRAAGASRPVAVQIDAWFRDDAFVMNIEHTSVDAAERVAEALIDTLQRCLTADPVPVANGLCSVDLRGNSIGTVRAAARGPVESVAPLTEVQEAMYLRGESEAAGAYIEQIVVALPDGIDAQRLAEAITSATQVMPLLRGAVAWDGLADPVLVVSVDSDCVRIMDAVDPALEVAALSDRPELFRAAVAPGRLVLTFHHLVVDGWTTRIIMQHIDDYYSGRPVSHSADHRMLEHMLISANQTRRPMLDRAPAVLLPVLERTPSSQTGVERNVDVTRLIDKESAEGIRRIAARNGVTFAVVAHAGWALLLGGGTDRVRFGSIGQRRPAGHEDAPGMYIETRTVDVQPTVGTDTSRLLQAMNRALRTYESGALVNAGSGAMYESAVIVDDARGTGSLAYFLGHPLKVVSSRERTGLPITASILDMGKRAGIEITLNCDTAHFSSVDGQQLLDRYIEILVSFNDSSCRVDNLEEH